MSLTELITNTNFKITKYDRYIIKKYNKYLYKIYNNVLVDKIYNNETLNRIVSILFFIKKDFNKINVPEILTIYYLDTYDLINAHKYYNDNYYDNIIYYFKNDCYRSALFYDKFVECSDQGDSNYLIAIELYKLFIKKNKSTNLNIYLSIGICYYNLEKYDKAINYFLLSYQNDKHKKDNVLLYYIAEYYYNIKKNYSLSKKYLLLSAKHGNINALDGLGIYYENKIKDIDTALRYYNLACTYNHPASQLNLGNYYYSKGNYDESLKYYFLAINNKQSNDKLIGLAYYNIGKHYDSNVINFNKAIKYLKLSFEKGMVDSGLLLLNYDEKYVSILETYKNNNNILIGLASYYEQKDVDKTIEYYNKAFENDNNDVRVIKYLYLYHFINNKDSKYKIYLNIIIEQHADECARLLGKHYEIIGDYDNCIKYYMIGINKGCILSMNNLGVYYLSYNPKLAYKYIKMACDKGCKISIYNLGYYYELINDIPNSIKYYKEYIDDKSNDINKGIESLENIFIKYPQYLIKELTIYNFSYVYYYTHPKLVYIKKNFIINDFECDICYEKTNNYVLSECKHKYCISCYLKIDSCAFCRKTFN